MIPFVRFAASLLLLTTIASAQITSVTTLPIGPGCNVGPTGCCAVVSQPTTLAVGLDANMRLQFDVIALEGCCGIAIPARFLVIGDQPAAVPLPFVGSDCLLHLVPVALLATTDDNFLIDLPAGLPPTVFLAQAAALITSPLPSLGTTVLTLTSGLQVSLQ